PRRLDEEDVAPGAGDRETGGDTRHRRALRRLLPEPLPPERVAHERLVDDDRWLRVAGGDARRRLPQPLAELALELANAGLACVLGHDQLDQLVRDLDLVLAQPVALALAREEVAAGDRDLLIDRVAVEADDLHPVEQRSGNRL